MAHTSAKRWPQSEQLISNFCYEFIGIVNNAEEAYQQFQELYDYVGGTDQALADLLFQDENGSGAPGTATPEQVAKAADAKAAMVALHQLFQAASGEAAATQEDRLALLRRMV